MKHTKKAVALAIVAFLLLAGCYKGEVTKKRGCKDGKPCEILVVDPGSKRERWIEVDKALFDQCAVGEWYEDKGCGIASGMRNIPLDEEGDPLTDEKESKPKEVCVEAESHREGNKKTLLTITWFIGSMEPDKRKHTISEFKRCRLAAPGQVAYLLLEHHTVPSTVMCRIYYIKGGKQVILDRNIAVGLGDCKVQASVPE